MWAWMPRGSIKYSARNFRSQNFLKKAVDFLQKVGRFKSSIWLEASASENEGKTSTSKETRSAGKLFFECIWRCAFFVLRLRSQYKKRETKGTQRRRKSSAKLFWQTGSLTQGSALAGIGGNGRKSSKIHNCWKPRVWIMGMEIRND